MGYRVNDSAIHEREYAAIEPSLHRGAVAAITVKKQWRIAINLRCLEPQYRDRNLGAVFSLHEEPLNNIQIRVMATRDFLGLPKFTLSRCHVEVERLLRGRRGLVGIPY